MIKVGFTGTKKRALTDSQAKGVANFLIEQNAPVEFHHGDCIGADAEAHDLAWNARASIEIHPPSDPKKRAWKGLPGRVVVWPERPYLVRNHDIVDTTEVLLACPYGSKEEVRSGTWATIRYARQQGKKVIIFFPDGGVSTQNPDGSSSYEAR